MQGFLRMWGPATGLPCPLTETSHVWQVCR